MRAFVFLVFLACALRSASGAATQAPEPGAWSLSTDGERISLWANDVPLKRLMEAISDFTPAEIDVDSLPDENITVRYFNVSLDDLLLRLGVSFVLTYAPDASGEAYSLESAWVSHYQPQPGASPAGTAAGAAGGSPGVELGRVGDLLQALGYEDGSQVSNDFGRLYRTPYPVTMQVDGDLDEWPEEIPWHRVSHTMGIGTATNDADISFEFASAADEENVYMAFKIADDAKVLDLSETYDAANEDSLEVQIGEEQFLIKRHHVWREGPDGQPVSSGKQYVSLNNETTAVIYDGSDGWTVEVKMPNETIGLEPGQTNGVPMEIILNDDDDGGEADNRLRWSAAAGSGADAGSTFQVYPIAEP